MSDPKTETPRTDAKSEHYADYGMDFVPTDFARQLERELTQYALSMQRQAAEAACVLANAEQRAQELEAALATARREEREKAAKLMEDVEEPTYAYAIRALTEEK